MSASSPNVCQKKVQKSVIREEEGDGVELLELFLPVTIQPKGLLEESPEVCHQGGGDEVELQVGEGSVRVALRVQEA